MKPACRHQPPLIARPTNGFGVWMLTTGARTPALLRSAQYVLGPRAAVPVAAFVSAGGIRVPVRWNDCHERDSSDSIRPTEDGHVPRHALAESRRCCAGTPSKAGVCLLNLDGDQDVRLPSAVLHNLGQK